MFRLELCIDSSSKEKLSQDNESEDEDSFFRALYPDAQIMAVDDGTITEAQKTMQEQDEKLQEEYTKQREKFLNENAGEWIVFAQNQSFGFYPDRAHAIRAGNDLGFQHGWVAAYVTKVCSEETADRNPLTDVLVTDRLSFEESFIFSIYSC